jgi:Domain of unknown function DUF222.
MMRRLSWGWVLRWSEAYTAVQVRLAFDLVRRLPMVLDALRAGRLDRERALAFADALQHVDDQVAAAVAAKLVDRAEGWTLAQLRDKLRYHIDRADPAAKRRRYRKAVTERGVWLQANDDGTATLAGANLPPHRAAAAFDRLDQLARAARRDGDPRTLSQLRADAFTDLLTGTPFHITPTTDPITADADAAYPRCEPDLLPPDPPRHPAGPAPDADQSHEPQPLDDPNHIDLYDYDQWCLTDEDRWWLHRLYTNQPTNPDTEPTSPAAERTGSAPTPGDNAHPDGDTGPAGNPDAVGSPDPGGSHRPSTGLDLDGLAGEPLPGNRCVCGGLLPTRQPHGADVHIELTTLIGLDDHPALITGLGPIPAELARLIAHDPHHKPTWRWSVYDPDGHLRHHGHITHRPTTGTHRSIENAAPGSRTRGEHDSDWPTVGTDRADDHTLRAGTDRANDQPNQQWCRCRRYDTTHRRTSIELLLTTSTLTDLTTHPDRAPGYQNLIADIARQIQQDTHTNPPNSISDLDPTRHLPPSYTARHPDAAETAFIRARDRSCRTPNCRKPATACEIDHRIEYAKGGLSHRGNCECRCKRHHTLRHRTGFTITQHGHTTTWTTRNGRTYPVPPDKDIKPTHE